MSTLLLQIYHNYREYRHPTNLPISNHQLATYGQRKNPNNIIINWQLLLFRLTKVQFPKSLKNRLNEKENGAEMTPNKRNLGLILRTRWTN